MKHLILCDFDGTISMRDMSYELLCSFTRGNWEEIDRLYREGEIGSREAYEQIGGICKVTPDQRSVKENQGTHLRPGRNAHRFL